MNTADEIQRLSYEEVVTESISLSDVVGIKRTYYNISLPYASFLNTHPMLDRIEIAGEGQITIIYHIKGGGKVELRRESTSIGSVVVKLDNCPKELSDELKAMERGIIHRINELGMN